MSRSSPLLSRSHGADLSPISNEHEVSSLPDNAPVRSRSHGADHSLISNEHETSVCSRSHGADLSQISNEHETFSKAQRNLSLSSVSSPIESLLSLKCSSIEPSHSLDISMPVSDQDISATVLMLKTSSSKSSSSKHPILDNINSQNLTQWIAASEMKLAKYGPGLVRPLHVPSPVLDRALWLTLLDPAWCLDNVAHDACVLSIAAGNSVAVSKLAGITASNQASADVIAQVMGAVNPVPYSNLQLTPSSTMPSKYERYTARHHPEAYICR